MGLGFYTTQQRQLARKIESLRNYVRTVERSLNNFTKTKREILKRVRSEANIIERELKNDIALQKLLGIRRKKRGRPRKI